MRSADSTLAFPIILFAILLVVAVGPNLANVVIAIALVLWARYARVIRGEVLALKERDFIARARVAGCSHLRILLFHLFPNTVNTLLVLVDAASGVGHHRGGVVELPGRRHSTADAGLGQHGVRWAGVRGHGLVGVGHSRPGDNADGGGVQPVRATGCGIRWTRS